MIGDIKEEGADTADIQSLLSHIAQRGRETEREKERERERERERRTFIYTYIQRTHTFM